MSMSRDRVVFSILCRKLDDKMCSVICSAFSIKPREIPNRCSYGDERFEITCRPSQFARFMILRDMAGLPNGFKDLKPRLVKEVRSAAISVADRRNSLWDDCDLIEEVE